MLAWAGLSKAVLAWAGLSSSPLQVTPPLAVPAAGGVEGTPLARGQGDAGAQSLAAARSENGSGVWQQYNDHQRVISGR